MFWPTRRLLARKAILARVVRESNFGTAVTRSIKSAWSGSDFGHVVVLVQLGLMVR